MPEVTLVITEENKNHFAGLEAFKATDGKVTVWVGADKDAVAAELNPALEANKNTILKEKGVLEDKYKALVATSGADDVKTANLIAAAEAKAKNAISEADQKLLDAAKKVKDITPEFLTEAVTKYPLVNQKLTDIEARQSNGEFFKATGFKSEKAFQKAITDKEANPKLLKHYTETKTENGKEVTTAYADIKKEDGTTEKVKFSDYVDKHADWSIYKPALMDTTTSNNTWVEGSTPETNHSQPFNGQPNALLGAVIAGTNKVIESKKESAKAS